VAQGFQYRPITRRSRNFAKAMRRVATDAEVVMWRLLRDRRLVGFNFRRQVPFQNYVLDFPCFDPEIVIEVDGSQHFESKRDKRRDSALAVEGFRILSYWNNDVLQRPRSVLERIFAHLSGGRD
jgi:very-short-patch-repair endonuclease